MDCNWIRHLYRSRRYSKVREWSSIALFAFAVGCGTTRMTDTSRTATEQLLISNAVDQAVSQIDFRPLAGKKVYFDPQYIDSTVVDRGYVISSLRQQLLASGCIVEEDKSKATYIVEARAGAVGTDRYCLLVGVPQMTVPTFVPGQPSQIPEIPLAKKSDGQGAAKIAVFAYNRRTGERVWQSGAVESYSDARDTWVAGLGPFRAGTILHGTEFAGEEIPLPLHSGKGDSDRTARLAPVTAPAAWAETPVPKPGWVEMFASLADAAHRADKMKPTDVAGVKKTAPQDAAEKKCRPAATADASQPLEASPLHTLAFGELGNRH
jgi:hypothetical protein